MPDKKLTDNEIIKAFEACYIKGLCNGCPIKRKTVKGCNNLLELTLDLLNRKQAENEKNENIIRLADKTIETANAEIERLKKEYNEATNAYASAKGKLFRYWMLYGEIDNPLKEMAGDNNES